MANEYRYFTLYTTTLSVRRFRSKHEEGGVSARGLSSPRTIKTAVDGTVNVTFSPLHQRVHNLILVFDGDESDPWGSYADFINYYEEGVAQFVDWDHVTTYNVVIMNQMITPSHLSPVFFPAELSVQLMEKTAST